MVEKMYVQLERLRPTMTDREVTKSLQITGQLLRSRHDYLTYTLNDVENEKRSQYKKLKSKFKQDAKK